MSRIPNYAQAPAAAFVFATAVDLSQAKPRILVRSSEVIEHPWWGRIIHDMAGAAPLKQTYALDYCHDPKEILGYCDELGIDSEGLACTPHMLPGEGASEDRAAEILRKSKGKVPYQASLDWRGGSKFEFLDFGNIATVNGRQVEGPLTIVRAWNVTGIAICPYGADPNTYALFAKAPRGWDVSIAPDNPLPQPAKPMSADQTKDNFRQQFNRYAKAFGPEKAFALIDAGTSYEAALEAELAAQKQLFSTQFEATKKAADEALAKANTERDEATKKAEALAAQFQGETRPVPTGEDESVEKPTGAHSDAPQTFQQFSKKVIRLPK
jgi:hypothetical protein